MPGGNGTGPMGMGPMTGRAAGYCAGYPAPGFANPVSPRLGLGFGRGRGRGLRGFTGYPYFGFGGMPYAGYGIPPVQGYGMAPYPVGYGGAAFTPQMTTQQEVDQLRSQAEYLKGQLDAINNRIKEIGTSPKK